MTDVASIPQTAEILAVSTGNHLGEPATDVWQPDQTAEVLALPKSTHPEPKAEPPQSPEFVPAKIAAAEPPAPVTKPDKPMPTPAIIPNRRKDTIFERQAARRELPMATLVKLALEQGDNPFYRKFRYMDLDASTTAEKKKINQLLGQRIIGCINYLTVNPRVPLNGDTATELAGLLRLGIERYSDRAGAIVARYRKWTLVNEAALRQAGYEATLAAYIQVCRATTPKSVPMFEAFFASQLRAKIADTMFEAALNGQLYTKHEKNMGALVRALRSAAQAGAKEDQLLDAVMEKLKLPEGHTKEYVILLDSVRRKIREHKQKIVRLSPVQLSDRQRQEKIHLDKLAQKLQDFAG